MRSPHSGPGPNPDRCVRFRNGRSRIRAAERWRAFSVVLHIAGTARTVYNKKKHPALFAEEAAMSQEIHYLETGSQDPFYNLAFEETVLRSRRSGEYLLLWQNDNTIVIGQNQNAEG